MKKPASTSKPAKTSFSEAADHVRGRVDHQRQLPVHNALCAVDKQRGQRRTDKDQLARCRRLVHARSGQDERGDVEVAAPTTNHRREHGYCEHQDGTHHTAHRRHSIR